MNYNEIEKKVEEICNNIMNKYFDISNVFRESYTINSFKKFIINKENINEVNNFIYEKLDVEESNITYSELNSFIKTINFKYENINNSKEYTPIKFDWKLYVSTITNLIIKNNFEIINLTKDLIFSFQKQNEFNDYNSRYWYRGQSDFEWGLTPSYYRGLINNKFVDFKELETDYINFGLLPKYENIFNKTNICYDFISFMQHSVGFSPLLDFSSNPLVALFFAFDNYTKFNYFTNQDSSLLRLEIDDKKYENNHDDVDNTLKNYKVYYLANQYIIGNPLKGKNVNTFYDIIQALTPKYRMVDVITNDRMKYQNGKFIIFYDFVMIQGKIFSWLNSNLKMKKYRINKKDKVEFYDYLNKNLKYYDIDHLLNPYKYFNE